MSSTSESATAPRAARTAAETQAIVERSLRRRYRAERRFQAYGMMAVMAGGALCGLAGAYVATVYTPLWVEGMIAGKGWIALALTTFATWRPARVLLGAYLFGGVTMLQFHLQGQGVQIASQLLTMLPYLATIVVLVLISRNPTFIRVNMPASLGKPFYPGS